MTAQPERRGRRTDDTESHASQAAAQSLWVAGGITGLMLLSVLVAFLLVR